MDERKPVAPAPKAADKDKKLKKVTNGPAQIKKKGGAAKFAQLFFVEDLKSVASYVGMQILLPAMKKMFVDMINSAANSLVNGLGSSSAPRKSVTSNISYRPYLEARDPRENSRPSYAPNRAVYDYGEVSLSSEADAKHVVEMMEEIVSQYPAASVADLYQLVGWVPNPSDYDWGWTNLRDTQIVRTSDGRFVIRFPRIRPIDR